MALGEAGQIEATPQQLVEGKWKRAPNARSAVRWRARCYVRDWGNVRREICRFGKTKVEATKHAQEAVEALLKGADAAIQPQTLLVDAGTLWLERIRKSTRSERTKFDYAYAYHRYVEKGTLRGLTLAQVTPQRVRLWLEGVMETYGVGSAKISRTIVSSILQAAVDDGVLDSNAVRSVRPLTTVENRAKTRDHRRAFTREERDGIVEYAYGLCSVNTEPRTWRKHRVTADLIALMAGTGMRIEEARSVEWPDVRLDAGRVIVRGTKTESAVRVSGAPEWLCERLRESPGRKYGVGYVVPSPGLVGPPRRKWDQSNSASAVRKVLDDLGFTWAIPHTFRRTVVTLLHHAGMSDGEIADQVGHKDPALTMRVYVGREPVGDRATISGLL